MLPLSLTLTSDDVPGQVAVALLAGSLEEKLRKAAALGYDGVELMVLEPQLVDSAGLSALLAHLRLRVAAVASGAQSSKAGLTLLADDPVVAVAAYERLEALIDLAAALAAPVVTVGSFRGRAAVSDSQIEAHDALAAALDSAAAYAAPQGVRLALEPLNRYESDILINVEETLAFCRRVGAANLGVLFDTFHANIEEASYEGSLYAAMQADRLFHVHLGDSNRLPPGQGHIPFAAIVQMLATNHYAGWLSAELFPLPTPDAAAEATIRHMRALLHAPVPKPMQHNEESRA